jgi:DNA replication protein DnaC
MTNKQFEEVERLRKASPTKSGECPTCGSKAFEVDAGVLAWPSAGTYLYDGKKHPCDCEEQEALFRHYLLAHIPQEYMTLGVDAYYGDPDALQAAQEYLEKWPNFRKHGMGIGFYSKTQGTGKTFLACYLARELVKRGESVYYVYFRNIVSTYELPYDVRKDEESRLRDCTVLILDEVARPVSEAQRAFFAEKFEELIRHRSNYNKVTVLTSNLIPRDLDEIYPRTYSLLAAKEKSVEVDGPDVRKQYLGSLNGDLAAAGETRPID